MYLTPSFHHFSLCSGLNVFGHVDSVLDSVMEFGRFTSFDFVRHWTMHGGFFEALYVC